MRIAELTVTIRPETGRLRLGLWRAEASARYSRGPLHPVRHRHVLAELARHPQVLDALAEVDR